LQRGKGQALLGGHNGWFKDKTAVDHELLASVGRAGFSVAGNWLEGVPTATLAMAEC